MKGTVIAGFSEADLFTDPTADWDFDMATVDEQTHVVGARKSRRRPVRKDRPTQSGVP